MKKNKKLFVLCLLGIVTTLSFSTTFIAKTVDTQTGNPLSKDIEDVANDDVVKGSTDVSEPSYIWPTTSKEVIKDFSTEYDGIVISGAEGDSVISANSGVVTQAGWGDEGEGYFVTIEHENDVTSTYSHLKDVPVVSVGDEVEQGEIIGYLGHTGMATKSILTFSMTENDNSVDPQIYI